MERKGIPPTCSSCASKANQENQKSKANQENQESQESQESQLIKCSDCPAQLCLPCIKKKNQRHKMCLECGEKLVCHGKGICSPCDIPYHWITEKMAVGSCAAPYSLFDIVFNLNGGENNVEHGKERVTVQCHPPKERILVYAWGIWDEKEDVEKMEMPFQRLKELVTWQKAAEGKILIHCFAGFSRSVAVAAAYMAMTEGGTVREAVERIREKRKYIGPNPSFLDFFETKVAEWRAETTKTA